MIIELLAPGLKIYNRVLVGCVFERCGGVSDCFGDVEDVLFDSDLQPLRSTTYIPTVTVAY